MRNLFASTIALCAFFVAVALFLPGNAWTRSVGFIGTVDVNQGGTGTTLLTDGGILLGSGTGAVTAAAVLASGEILIGDGTTDPTARSLSGDATMSATGVVTSTLLNDVITLCGQNVSSSTIYGGPAAAAFLGGGAERVIGGTICNALDSTTEATADAPIHADFPAFKVFGFWCYITTDPSNDVVLTMRSAAANLTPSLTCTIAGSGSAKHCSTTTSTTTDVAAGATIAMKVVTTEDLSAQDFWCKAYISVR